jgi:hypothetical protein
MKYLPFDTVPLGGTITIVVGSRAPPPQDSAEKEKGPLPGLPEKGPFSGSIGDS